MCAGGELFPEFVPPPDAGPGGDREAVAELVGEHGDLAAVVSFVGKHVSEHGAAGGPSGRPSATREFCDATRGRSEERVGEHAQAERGGFFVSGGGLFDCAAAGVEVGEEELVHSVVDGERGEEGVAKRAVERSVRLSWYESRRPRSS